MALLEALIRNGVAALELCALYWPRASRASRRKLVRKPVQRIVIDRASRAQDYARGGVILVAEALEIGRAWRGWCAKCRGWSGPAA